MQQASLDMRMLSILSNETRIPVHSEKFAIIATCFEAFHFFVDSSKVELDLSPPHMSLIDTALAIIRSLIKQLSNDNWIHYVAAAPPQTALTSLSKAMKDISTHIKFVAPDAAQIFDVPEIRWQEADQIDTDRLLTSVKSLKAAQLANCPVPKQNILDNISSALTKTLTLSENSFSLPSKFNKFVISSSQIIVDEVIGKGTFSIIYKVTFKNEIYALKFFTSAHLKSDHFDQFYSELYALSSLNHPNIIKLKAIVVTPFCLLTEYVPGGSLFTALRSSVYPSLPLDRIADQIRQALFYCHKNDFTHGDVKSLNILLTQNFDVKLCDFGSCRQGTSSNIEGPIGTPAWSAPELFQTPRTLTHKCDTFSFGVVLLEMATRKLPNPSNRIVPPTIPNRLRLQIENCISIDPQLRPPLDRLSTIHFKSDTLAVDASLLDYMVSVNSRETIDLLADIAFEMPETSTYLIQKVVQMPLPSPDRLHSILRLLRSLCNSADAASQLIQFGAVSLCMNCLDSEDLQVSALFLLISILTHRSHFLNQSEINSLRELDDSDLAVMAMMLGSRFDEGSLGYFLARMKKCHDRLISTYLVALRKYFSQYFNVSTKKVTPNSSSSSVSLKNSEENDYSSDDVRKTSKRRKPSRSHRSSRSRKSDRRHKPSRRYDDYSGEYDQYSEYSDEDQKVTKREKRRGKHQYSEDDDYSSDSDDRSVRTSSRRKPSPPKFETPTRESGIAEEVFNIIVEFLRLNDEVLMKQVISFLTEIAAKVEKLKVSDRQILLISKWVFVKNIGLHEDSLNLMSLLFARKQITIECEMNEFIVIVLHSLPLSHIRQKVTGLLLRILDDEKRAKWFVSTQIEKVTKIAGEGTETRKCLLKIIVLLFIKKGFEGISKDSMERILKILCDEDSDDVSRKILRAF